MSFAQFAGFAAYPPASVAISSTQVSGGSPTSPSTRGCCENGRPIMTDPHTGQTICSCQYGAALLNYPRVPGIPDGVYSAYAAAAASQGYSPLGAEGSAFYPTLAGAPDNPEAWRALTQASACFPYDPTLAMYPYGAGYGGLDLNSRRKNATRENTNTLKAWLFEHRKNPYPTKGEKIMLAIITKMTLTQVSTWFANARRRLKKENKMTWSPRNRTEDGADDMDDDDDIENKELGEGHGPEGDVSDVKSDIDLKDLDDLDDLRDDIKEDDSDEPCGVNKVINVDEDSNHSFKDFRSTHSFNDSEGDEKENDSAAKRLKLRHDSCSDSSSDSESRITSTSSAFPLSRQTESKVTKDAEPQTKPKIWSVSEFLNSSSPSKDNDKKQPVVSNQPKSSQSPGYLYIPHGPHALTAGRFAGLAGYPMSLGHNTLSYPYTLTTSAPSKTSVNHVSHNGGVPFSENLQNSDKFGRFTVQSRLFSPARDLDGIRNGDDSPESMIQTRDERRRPMPSVEYPSNAEHAC